MNKIFYLLNFFVRQFDCILILLLLAFDASASPTSLTYQGRILKSDGTPLEYNNVSFIFQITDPSGTCIIYQEQISGYNMVNSGGVFDVAIGQGTIQYPLGGTTTVLDVFNNTGTFTCGSCSYSNGNYTCVNGSTPYTATSSDNRKLRVSFYDGNGWKTITPDNVVRSVPFAGYALAAQKLGDKVAADFLTKAGLPICGSGFFLTWNGTSLSCAAVSGASGGTVTDVTSTNSYLSVSSGTSTPSLTVNVGTSAGTVAAGNDPRFTSAIQSGGPAGGALSGTYPNPSLANSSVDTVNIVDSSVTTTKLFVNPGINRIVATDSATGTTLSAITCAANQLLSWSIASGWQCTSQNSLAVGSASLAANFTGSLSGDITGTQSATIVSKIGGYAVDLSVAPTLNQVLSWNGTGWVAADLPAGNSGTVTNVTSANADINVATPTTTPVLTLNSGVAGGAGDANKIAKLNASGLLAINMIPSLDTAKITTGTLGVARGGTGQSSYLDGELLIGNTVGNTLTKATLTAGTGISITNGNGSITIANNGLTGASIFSGDVSGTSSTTSVDKIKGVAVAPAAYSSGQVLRYNGTNWVNTSVDAATDLSGILPVANGGTGASSLGSGNLLIGNGTSAVSSLASGLAGNVVYATGVASWSSGSPDAAGLVDKSSTQTLSGAKAFNNYIQMNAQNAVHFADLDSTNYVALRSPATVSANVIWTLPDADGTAGQLLKTDGAGNLSWTSDATGTGTVTSVTSANSDISVAAATATTTPVLTLNSGIAGGAGDANKIAKLSGSGLLAVNMIPSFDAAKIATGTLAVARGGTGQSSYLDGEILIGNTVGNTLTKATLTAGTGISITNGNGSISIANSGLTGASTFTGDISGTSTTISVDKIKGVSVSPAAYSSGQVLRYNGTNWVNELISAATDLTGTLAIANGGTGATTASAARTNLGLGTVAVLNRGSAAGNVPSLGVGGLSANQMCTADGSGSAIICTSGIPISSQWVTAGSNIYYSAGSVGIGTSTPQVLLDIGDPVGAYPTLTGPLANFFANLGSSPDNNHKNIFGLWDTQPSAADAGGGLAFGSRDVSGANQIGALIKTLRVSTASDWNHHLAFFTRNAGIVGERLRITDSGKVGIGTTAPNYTLHVVGTAGLSTGTAWTNASDRRLKEIHGNYEYGLNEILKLRTVRYNYKKNNPLKLPSDVPMTGFIAQEVQKIIPDAVKTREDGYLELNVDPIHWATVNAVQDLHQLCEMSRKQVSSIESRLKAHDREIASLKEENIKVKAENTMIKQALCELGKRNFCNQAD